MQKDGEKFGDEILRTVKEWILKKLTTTINKTFVTLLFI